LLQRDVVALRHVFAIVAIDNCVPSVAVLRLTFVDRAAGTRVLSNSGRKKLGQRLRMPLYVCRYAYLKQERWLSEEWNLERTVQKYDPSSSGLTGIKHWYNSASLLSLQYISGCWMTSKKELRQRRRLIAREDRDRGADNSRREIETAQRCDEEAGLSNIGALSFD
jgi:hypothetical protein